MKGHEIFHLCSPFYIFCSLKGLAQPYKITPPAIKSGTEYHFTTNSGIHYEVRFGRKQNDILSANIVFGVTNDEYEGEEYVVTNKGDVFRVMATIVEIVHLYMEQHPNVHSYEFTGEPTSEETENQATVRLKLYKRYIKRVFDENWDVVLDGNKITIKKKRRR